MSRLVAALLLAAALLAGCSDDGRELADPDPDLTASVPPTTVPATASTAVGPGPLAATGEQGFELTIEGVEPGGTLPLRFTCEGEDESPPLRFANVPPNTFALAVVVQDLQPGRFIHWVVSGIPFGTEALAAGEVPDEATETLNDFGRVGYAGPCPPEGDASSHRYRFTAFALGAEVVLDPNEGGPRPIEEIRDNTITSSYVDVRFSRRG